MIWSVAKTMTAVDLGATPIGFRGIAGLETGADVTLIATTGEASGNVDRLVVFVDSGSATPTGKVLLSAPPSTTFRSRAGGRLRLTLWRSDPRLRPARVER
jgi:hypothetical protein